MCNKMNAPAHSTILFSSCKKTALLLVIFITAILMPNKVSAESVVTSVTVGNSPPSFTSGPAESPASTNASPTNVGSTLTFEATATDSNVESYYLIVCKTNGVTPVNGDEPTCPGDEWCISALTASGDPTDCSYVVQASDTNESYDWYAFVCDANASAASCSSAAQGSGDSASPFSVNHPPSFTAEENNSPQDPGANITWSTTASDADSAGTADTVKLLVCKTAGVTAGDCDGGETDRWCQSDFESSDPTCSYSLPTPTVDGSNDAYVYIIDSHNLAAGGGTQGSNSSFTVNNVAPVVSSVTLNSGSDITLTEGTTTSVVLTATITDNNSCSDVSSVAGSLYRSGIAFSGCDSGPESDANNCYALVSCSVGGGNSCDGSSDASASYTCTVNVQYYADPTDANTIYSAENWLASVIATDDDAASSDTEVAAGVEMNSLVAMDITSAINYGNLSVGQKNDPLDKVTVVTATGNVGLDEELSGDDMDNGGTGTIDVAYQKYALASSTAYASGTTLSQSPTEAELNCSKTTSSTAATASTYWGLEIPGGTEPGTYSGTNTITAVKGETANW
jgi:hypothetical protein